MAKLLQSNIVILTENPVNIVHFNAYTTGNKVSDSSTKAHSFLYLFHNLFNKHNSWMKVNLTPGALGLNWL